MYDNSPTVTAKQRTYPAVRSVARACVEIAKRQQREERIISALHRLDPHIVLGERYDCRSVVIDAKPFVIFSRGSIVIRLVGDDACRLVRQDLARYWCPASERVPREDWLLLKADLPEYDMIHWAQCALIQIGVRVSV